MSELKVEFEAAGFLEVSTYLNSGNVVFSSDADDIESVIEKMIADKFGFKVSVYVILMDELISILSNSLTIRTANTVKKICKNE